MESNSDRKQADFSGPVHSSAADRKSPAARSASPVSGANRSAGAGGNSSENRDSGSTRRSEGNSHAKEEHPPRRNIPPHPANRSRKRSPQSFVVPIILAVALLALIVYVGSCWFISAINRSTYLSNIFVNNIDISSYTYEEGKEYLRAQADELINASHTLSWNGSEWSFRGADFGAGMETDSIMDRAWNIGHVGSIFDRSSAVRSLRRNPIYLEAPLQLDETSIDNFVDSIYNQLYIAPQNAQLGADLNSPFLAIEATAGQELDRETAREQIMSMLQNNEASGVLPVLTLEPSVSTEAAMSSMDLIVEYKTDTSARDYNGRFNVRKGLMCFNGMIVQPGEEVNFNDVVGPRSPERGWMEGTEYIGGGRTQIGFGGGICQASSTLYGAVVKAGMTILQRSPHSMTVAYVDPSFDAAVTDTSDGKNLRFRNDTQYPITIFTEVTKKYAMVQIYGVRPPYRYELESNIISQDTSAVKVAYVDDTEGEHCYYKDEKVLYKEGHTACQSEGWRVAYDWETGEEVERIQLSFDMYASGYDIYWRGTHTRGEEDKGGNGNKKNSSGENSQA